MLNFSATSQNAIAGLMEIAETGLAASGMEPDQEESRDEPGDEPEEEISEETVVPEEEETDNTPETPEDSPFDKALKQAQAELEGERNKNALLVAKTSLPPIPDIIPFGNLTEEIQAEVIEYCNKYNLDPHQYAHDVQVKYRERVIADHKSLESSLEARKIQGRAAIDEAILKHPKASELGASVAEILGKANLVENVKRMDSAGVLPEEIRDYALLLIEQAYKMAELEAKGPANLDEKRKRVLAATSEQKARLKKATRGETTRSASTPQSSQGESEKLFEAAFDAKNANPWKRLMG